MTTDIKYGVGYVRVIDEDGSEVRVTIEKRDRPTDTYKPYAVKDVAAIADALR